MSIVLYTIGFIALACSIVVLLLSLVGGTPMPEPELLVVDAPLPGEEVPAEEGVLQEAKA